MTAMLLLVLLLLISSLIITSATAINGIQTKPGCQLKCGNITVPYPFGMGKECSIEPWADILCDTTFHPPKPFIGNVEVVQFLETEVRIKNLVATFCNNASDFVDGVNGRLDLNNTPYTISSTKNMFTVLGCNVTGLATSVLQTVNYLSGCDTSCSGRQNIIQGSCSVGSGCCQSPITKGFNVISVELGRMENDTNRSTCGAAFLAEEAEYKFKASDLNFANFGSLNEVPLVLNFAVGNRTCEKAKQNATTYACKDNSHCSDSDEGTGYHCHCNHGYEGNPYLNQGCQDVDECEDPKKHDCQITCTNTQGSYYCSCPDGSYGDGKKVGKGCTKKSKELPILQLTLGLGFGFLFLLLVVTCLFMGIKERKLIKLKEKFFQQNGGLLLKQQISSYEGAGKSTKIFTTKELKLATNNYDQRCIIGQGGFGTVYKGILSDLRIVAIKKSKVIDESQLGQFINEIVILTQINHRNVVKLIGCCLENEVPLLVYEFVSNGTLSHLLHGEVSSLSWEDRLRIASETAGALSYLHSAASIPIIHRDVKSTNILLDEQYTAKVADFGASRLNPLDKTLISTIVTGTTGYLDPEYFHTSQLTEKSDVYSFGVVLAELLTGEKPLCFERSHDKRNLAVYFVLSMEENRFNEIIEARVANEGKTEHVHAVAQLAKRCLNMKGEKRPTMKEVAAELEGLRGYARHTWVHNSNKENMNSASEDVDHNAIPSSSYSSASTSKWEKEPIWPLNVPR